MKEERIIIEIDGDGRLTADAEGFEGDTCLKELEKLLADLSSLPAIVERKDEGERRRSRRRTVQMKRGKPK